MRRYIVPSVYHPTIYHSHRLSQTHIPVTMSTCMGPSGKLTTYGRIRASTGAAEGNGACDVSKEEFHAVNRSDVLGVDQAVHTLS